MTNPEDVLKRHEEMLAQWEGDEPGYQYDNAEPGMQDAVERARDAKPEMEGLDLSVGGADSPEGQLKAAFEKAGNAPDDSPADSSDEGPDGVTAPKDVGPTPPPLTEAPTEPWANLAHRLNQSQNAAPSMDPLLEKMRAVGWAPKEKTQPDWAKLQADLQGAERGAATTRALQQWGQAVAPQFHADANAGSEEIAAAKAALDVPREQQATEHAQQEADRAQLQHEAATKAAAKAAEADDPKSEESVRARAALQAEFGDTGKLPPDIEKYSANDIAKLTPTLGTIAGHQSAEHIAQGKEKAVADQKATDATAKEKAAAEKVAAGEAAKAADTESLGAAKRLWLKTSPYAKEHALTPDDLSDIKSRKDWEDFLRQASAPKGKAKGTPEGPITRLDQITEPGLRALVHSMLDGYPVAEGIDRKTKTHALELATQINPQYDPTTARAYGKVVEHQATGTDVLALDVARQHIATAKAAIPENADAQFVNRIKQAVATGSGDPEFKPFTIAADTAAHEIAKINNIGDAGGKEMVVHQLDAAQSPAQLRAAFDTFEELMKGKQHGLERQREKVAPKPYGGPAAPDLPPAVGAPNEAPPPGSVTLFDNKRRRGQSVSAEAARAFIEKHKAEKSGDRQRYEVVGAPNR